MNKLTFEDGYNQALKDYESNKNLEDLYMAHALGQKGFWWHNPKMPPNYNFIDGTEEKHNDYKFITTRYDKGYFKALDDLTEKERNKMNCINCGFCSIFTDDELCAKAKCLAASKKGKTIYWAMTTIDMDNNKKIPGEDRVRSVLEDKEKPKWCPLLKSRKEN